MTTYNKPPARHCRRMHVYSAVHSLQANQHETEGPRGSALKQASLSKRAVTLQEAAMFHVVSCRARSSRLCACWPAGTAREVRRLYFRGRED